MRPLLLPNARLLGHVAAAHPMLRPVRALALSTAGISHAKTSLADGPEAAQSLRRRTTLCSLATASLLLCMPKDPHSAARAVATAAMDPAAGVAAVGSSETGATVVYVTVPSQEIGDKLGSLLVENKLAACVNIVPGITSIYWWDGKVNKDAELLLIIKTRVALLSELTTFVKANHPYDEPEVVALPIQGGSLSYLSWLMKSTKEA